MICQAMEQRVKPERLNLQQCMAMACNRATPVARLGLSWLGKRTIAPNERRVLAQLAKAECESLGSEIAAFALAILGAAEAYDVEGVVAFFDSLNPEVRRGAWGWLTPQSAGYADPGLWSRLLESPFDDVRIRLIDALNVRVKAPRTALAPAVQTQNLTAVWTSVLLAVHRGGRAKLKALRQISDAIAARPERADELMPVLAVAIRSVRPPEARAGLSAILSAVDARPDLESVLSRHIPELRLVPVGVPA
jgi:hypothetical protein